MKDLMPLSWMDMERSCEYIVRKIKTLGLDFHTVAPVTRGGLIPGVMIAHMLGINSVKPIQFQSRDGKATEKSIADWKDMTSYGTRVLVVDDILDSGLTFDILKKHEHRAAMTHYAAIVVNQDAQMEHLTTAEVIAGSNVFKANRKDLWVVFPWEQLSNND